MNGRQTHRMAVLLLLLAATPAAAGTWEVGPVGGLRGGSDDSPDAAPVFGFAVTRALRTDAAIEATWLHQASSFDARGETVYAPGHAVGLDADSLEIAGVYRPERHGRRPFVSMAIGAVRLAPDSGGFDSVWRTTLTVAGGATWPLSERVGLRLALRGRTVLSDVSLAGVCGGAGCSIRLFADGGFELQADAAVVFGF